DDYGLFLALSNRESSKKKVRHQTIDLIAYILINQILFYFLYSKKSKNKRLTPMTKIEHPSQLNKYFREIRKIDFEPIFNINVASKIPYKKEIVKHINDIIESLLDALRVDEIQQDLY